MPRKGHKSTKGVGDLYPEKKKVRGLCLTDTAMKVLDEQSKAIGISKSEMIEQFARGILKLNVDLNKEHNQVENNNT